MTYSEEKKGQFNWFHQESRIVGSNISSREKFKEMEVIRGDELLAHIAQRWRESLNPQGLGEQTGTTNAHRPSLQWRHPVHRHRWTK
jgi:hypothetical protein